MILHVSLDTRADRNYSCDNYYVSPEKTEKGIRVDLLFSRSYQEYVDRIYVKAHTDEGYVEVVSKYGSKRYPIDKPNRWRSGSIGLSYACCEVDVTFIPYMQDRWDALLATHEGGTAMIMRDEFTDKVNLSTLRTQIDGNPLPWLDFEYRFMSDESITLSPTSATAAEYINVSLFKAPVTVGEIMFELESYSTIINEWDDMAERPVRYIVDSRDLADSLTDKDAALRLAESMEEQHPEKLELVAKYMEFAADLGSDDAVAWLRDYHEVDDARYHAYD